MAYDQAQGLSGRNFGTKSRKECLVVTLGLSQEKRLKRRKNTTAEKQVLNLRLLFSRRKLSPSTVMEICLFQEDKG